MILMCSLWPLLLGNTMLHLVLLGIFEAQSVTVAQQRAVKALIAEVKILPATCDETYDSVDEERKFITLQSLFSDTIEKCKNTPRVWSEQTIYRCFRN